MEFKASLANAPSATLLTLLWLRSLQKKVETQPLLGPWFDTSVLQERMPEKSAHRLQVETSIFLKLCKWGVISWGPGLRQQLLFRVLQIENIPQKWVKIHPFARPTNEVQYNIQKGVTNKTPLLRSWPALRLLVSWQPKRWPSPPSRQTLGMSSHCHFYVPQKQGMFRSTYCLVSKANLSDLCGVR